MIDAGDPGFEAQLAVTDKVLAEIGADTVPRIRVFNKIDYLPDAAAQEARTAELLTNYPGCIVLSAQRSEDVKNLHQTIVQFFQKDLIETEIFLPWSAQELRGEIFASCDVLEEGAEEAGAFFRLRAGPDMIAKVSKLAGSACSG